MEFFIELRLSVLLIRMLIYVVYCSLCYFIASSSLVIHRKQTLIYLSRFALPFHDETIIKLLPLWLNCFLSVLTLFPWKAKLTN